VEALERAQQHWHQHQQQAPGFTIAIEREAGAPGTSVAQAVAARLHWPVYDHELLERIAEEMGLRVDLLKSVDERRQSWVLEVMEAFAGGKHVSESSYVRHLVHTLLALAAHGECVIVGRGAAQVLPRGSALKVRLVADLADRVKAISARFGLPAAEAGRKVEEIDRERTAFIRAHFQKDPAEPHQYDLILNTSRWSVADCAGLIVRALQILQPQAVSSK
jgi:cytidylate kinase